VSFLTLIHRSFPTPHYEKWFFFHSHPHSFDFKFLFFLFFFNPTMPKEGSKLKSNFLLFFKSSPFSRRGKKETLKDQEEEEGGGGSTQAFSSYEDFSTTAVGEAEPLPKSANTDATSTMRGSRSSFDANTSQQQGPNLPMTGRELSSIDGRVRVFFVLELKVPLCLLKKKNYSVSHLRHLKLGQIITRCQK